ncbi:hypothetical protein HN358_00230 [Candidatus Uhrbacteria bacterium]|nr:hypothetical protein [Candidatus Uhrbacteria bacterium]MBT7717276.1 hypothetical protein [Candidatus Uhrbacteria bacterium]
MFFTLCLLGLLAYVASVGVNLTRKIYSRRNCSAYWEGSWQKTLVGHLRVMFDNQALCMGSAIVIVVVSALAAVINMIMNGQILAWIFGTIVILIAVALGAMVVRHAV